MSIANDISLDPAILDRVYRWMLQQIHEDEEVSFAGGDTTYIDDCGEVNCTLLAENAAQEFSLYRDPARADCDDVAAEIPYEVYDMAVKAMEEMLDMKEDEAIETMEEILDTKDDEDEDDDEDEVD